MLIADYDEFLSNDVKEQVIMKDAGFLSKERLKGAD